MSGLIWVGFILHDLFLYARADLTDSKRTQIVRLKSTLENGDIIFQTSKSNQSRAIQIATNSKYSHMGIIYWQGVNLYVYEAAQHVKLTELSTWIDRGENRKCVVKRLVNSKTILTPVNLAKMKSVGNKFLNKDYDLYFEWSDEKIYCSELVWKIYKEALNIEIGRLEKLRDFNLDSPMVREKMNERYDDKIPLDEVVISPSSMFNSDKLKLVIEN
jgi:hypothetical protein